MPKPINDRLRDLLLRRAIDRTRMENACVREVLGLWRDLRRVVDAKIRSGLQTGEAAFGLPRADQLQRVAALMGELRDEIEGWLGRMAGCLARDLPLLAGLELEELPTALEAEIARTLAASMKESAELAEQEREVEVAAPTLSVSLRQVPQAQAAQLLASPVGGATFSTAFAGIGAALTRSLSSILTSGLLAGQSVPTVARSVQAAMGNKRHEAERIVRSEFVRVGNQANLLTYEQNKELLNGVQWSSVLDAATCFLAGTKIDIVTGSRPIECIRSGDEVLTPYGARLVVGVMAHRYDEELVILQAGSRTVVMTADHPVWADGLWQEAREVRVGAVVQTLSEEFAERPRSSDLASTNTDDTPSIAREERVSSRILLRIGMPVITIDFESDLPGRDREIYRVPTDLMLLKESNPRACEGDSDLSLQAIFPAEAAVASKRAEDALTRQAWADVKRRLALATPFHERRSATGLGAMTPLLVSQERFPTTEAIEPCRSDLLATCRADDIPMRITFRNRENLATVRAEFSNALSREKLDKTSAAAKHPEPGSLFLKCTSALTTNKFTRAPRPRMITNTRTVDRAMRPGSVETFPALTAKDIWTPFDPLGTRNRAKPLSCIPPAKGVSAELAYGFAASSELPGALERTKPSSGSSPRELLVAVLTCIERCRGMHLTTILSQLAQTRDFIVYNLEIEEAHVFFADGLLVHNCQFCASLDGKVWRNPADAKIPVVSSHPSCRCTLLPILANAEKLGIPSTPGTRASFNGQVPGDVTYKDWFAQQDAAFQRDVLGPTRFELFAAGKADVTTFAGVHGERRVADVVALVKRRG